MSALAQQLLAEQSRLAQQYAQQDLPVCVYDADEPTSIAWCKQMCDATPGERGIWHLIDARTAPEWPTTGTVCITNLEHIDQDTQMAFVNHYDQYRYSARFAVVLSDDPFRLIKSDVLHIGLASLLLTLPVALLKLC